MYRYSLYIFFVFTAFFTSCKVRKHAAVSKNTEKKELKELHVTKDLKKEINSWLGTPYKYGGVNKSGVDCSGLVNAIFLEVYEIKLPRTSRSIYTACKPVKIKDLREGDLVFFDYNGKGISHVGIYLSDSKYVHASASKGVVISDLNNEFTKKKIVGAGRVR